ncbi:hypothetical protein ACFQZC_38005 [Streptacidiphilus monticola]
MPAADAALVAVRNRVDDLPVVDARRRLVGMASCATWPGCYNELAQEARLVTLTGDLASTPPLCGSASPTVASTSRPGSGAAAKPWI